MNITAEAEETPANKIKICIDPGHGGENLGAEYEDYVEKDMTLIVAKAMYEELSKYEGIDIYMTRTEDKDMSLEERVDYAKSVDADFFFCLHFNMSENHTLFGAETWISAFGQNYARGYDFATIEMKLLTDTGLYDRGIKTRLNSKGTNYYGVLRMSQLEGFPGIIIEHCHLDQANDKPFYDHYDKLVEYGKLDATAVAMYYGLYSEELGRDFRDYTYEHTEVPDSVVKPDETPPEYCNIEITDIDTSEKENAYITLKIHSSDNDCRMLYYSYTLDDGVTFSEYMPWQTNEYLDGDSVSVRIPVEYDHPYRIAACATNLHGHDKISDIYILDGIDSPYTGMSEVRGQSDYEDYKDINHEDELNEIKRTSGPDTFLIVYAVALSVMLLILLFVIAYLVMYLKHNSRKR